MIGLIQHHKSFGVFHWPAGCGHLPVPGQGVFLFLPVWTWYTANGFF
jgi:hypothetical protein